MMMRMRMGLGIGISNNIGGIGGIGRDPRSQTMVTIGRLANSSIGRTKVGV